MTTAAVVPARSGRWWLPLLEGILALLLGFMFLRNTAVTSVSFVLGLDQPFVEPGYTSISRVLGHSDGRRQVASVNELPHLPPPWAG